MSRSRLMSMISWILCSIGILLLVIGLVLVSERPVLADELKPGKCLDCGGTCGGLEGCGSKTCTSCPCSCKQASKCICDDGT